MISFLTIINTNCIYIIYIIWDQNTNVPLNKKVQETIQIKYKVESIKNGRNEIISIILASHESSGRETFCR